MRQKIYTANKVDLITSVSWLGVIINLLTMLLEHSQKQWQPQDKNGCPQDHTAIGFETQIICQKIEVWKYFKIDINITTANIIGNFLQVPNMHEFMKRCQPNLRWHQFSINNVPGVSDWPVSSFRHRET